MFIAHLNIWDQQAVVVSCRFGGVVVDSLSVGHVLIKVGEADENGKGVVDPIVDMLVVGPEDATVPNGFRKVALSRLDLVTKESTCCICAVDELRMCVDAESVTLCSGKAKLRVSSAPSREQDPVYLCGMIVAPAW